MADTRSTPAESSTAESSTPAKKSTATKTSAKKSTTRKSAAKKSSAKKSSARKSAAKKSTAKKATAKRSPAKKAAESVKRTSPTASSSSLVARATAATQKPVEVGKALVGRAGERVADVSRAVAAPSSKFFARAPVRARELAADPEALRGLADKALHSASGRSGPLGEVAEEFKTLGRMVAAYARGDYRDIPFDSLIMVVAGLVYVVSPIDLIPESVPVAGYVDDAVAVGFVIRQVHHELTAFRTWEDQRSSKS